MSLAQLGRCALKPWWSVPRQSVVWYMQCALLVIAGGALAPSPGIGRDAPGRELWVYAAEAVGLGDLKSMSVTTGDTVIFLIAIKGLADRARSGRTIDVSSAIGNRVPAMPAITDERGEVRIMVEVVHAGDDILTFRSGDLTTNLELYARPRPEVESSPMPSRLYLPHRRDRQLTEGEIPWSRLRLGMVGEQGNVRFEDELLNLVGQRIRVRGTMVPPDRKMKQERFLLVQERSGCLLCPPEDLAQTIEVQGRDPVPVSFATIIVEGRFSLDQGRRQGPFLRLEDATVKKE